MVVPPAIVTMEKEAHSEKCVKMGSRFTQVLFEQLKENRMDVKNSNGTLQGWAE